jgi:hypothetical protein
MKTYSDALEQINEIISQYYWVNDRLQALMGAGYTLDFTWVKGGGVGTVFYLKRKRIYRIQVSASESRGKYDRAWCVVLPAEQAMKTSRKMTPNMRTLEQVC